MKPGSFNTWWHWSGNSSNNTVLRAVAPWKGENRQEAKAKLRWRELFLLFDIGYEYMFNGSNESSDSSSSSKSQPQSYSGNDLCNAEDHKTLPHDIFTITNDVLASQYNFEEEIGYGNWGSIWRVNNLHR
ncbi:hypothetical protein BY996DRAFT_6417604 [Phakopsora pachyrhizi]|nr:hypothetical protein BY996DRAFT_6417604 [Phakopsora pachyrhizi]